MVSLQYNVRGTCFDGRFACRDASPGIKMAKSLQKKTPHKTVKDVCQLCDATFTTIYNYSLKEPSRPTLLYDTNLRQNLLFSACRLLARRLLLFRVATGYGNMQIAEGEKNSNWNSRPMAGLVYILWVRLQRTFITSNLQNRYSSICIGTNSYHVNH